MADKNEVAAVVSGVEQTDASNTDASSLESPEALMGTYKHAVGELRQLLYCKVCIRPMYEPYTVACGHTFCYSCLRQWFENHRTNKTCPECRTPVLRQPAPAYTLREVVQLFLKTRDFLPPDDDIPDHEQARQDEATQVEKDRAERQVFGNSFGRPRSISPHHHHRNGIHDHQDGVRRCPNCLWELEHGYCSQCDTHVDIEYYDSDVDYPHPFHSPDGRMIPLGMVHGIEDWSVHTSDSEDESDDFGEMDDFIDDAAIQRHRDAADDDDDLSDVDSLELARQRLNSTGSAYSVGSARSPRAHNHSHPRLRRGTSEPTEGLLGRRHFDQSSSEESSSESETASVDTESRQWPIRTQNQTTQRVNFAPDPISSDEAEEMAATAASQPRHARKRRRVVADDSDSDEASPMPESSSTPARGERDQSSADRDQDEDSQDASRSRGPSPANSDDWQTEVSHHPDCAMHPNNRRPLRQSRGAPPVALSRFSRRGRRQVADD